MPRIHDPSDFENILSVFDGGEISPRLLRCSPIFGQVSGIPSTGTAVHLDLGLAAPGR